MKKVVLLCTFGMVALIGLSGMHREEPSRKRKDGLPKAVLVAPRPPMGWNSFDAYDCRITEAEFKANVDYLAQNLKPYGWEYAVMDYIWFNDNPGNWNNPKRRHGHPDIRLDENGRPIDQLVMDKNGRLWPSEKRFPSAAGGKGFKPIADYVHSKGLKFGLHIMRGIPRQAFYQNCPIKGATASAKDIAEPWDTCNWCNNMYGVDASKPGSQEYYDSLFELYAAWGVDFIKADDMMFPAYHKGEIEMMRKAIDKCGRPIVLSLSCGEAPVSQAAHLTQNANMWRISADFWDNWDALEHNFDLLNAWSPHIKENHWPDADMLPMGKLSLDNRPHGPERMSKFTPDEQQTMITLWCMARSPLMMGGDLLTLPANVKQLLTNDEVLAINQNSTDNRQVINHNKKAIWVATDPATQDRYVALFNLDDKPANVAFDFELESLRGTYLMRNLWEKKDLGEIQKKIQTEVPPHGARLFKISKRV